MVIADTGFFLALGNSRDPLHGRATQTAEAIKGPVHTTSAVVTETTHLLANFVGVPSSIAYIKSLADGAYLVFDLVQSDYKRVHSLMKKYSDLPMDLADASLILLAEYLQCGDILTSDRRDFATYRWSGRRVFKNLLIP